MGGASSAYFHMYFLIALSLITVDIFEYLDNSWSIDIPNICLIFDF